jgi:hypothetical protein
MRATITLLFALAVGLLIGYVDTRPNWDDAGITALGVLVTCGVLAAVSPKQWWLWAICVGGCVVGANLIVARNLGVLLVFMPALVGAASGMVVGRLWNRSGAVQA